MGPVLNWKAAEAFRESSGRPPRQPDRLGPDGDVGVEAQPPNADDEWLEEELSV